MIYNVKDLESKGYLHIKNWINNSELDILRNDYQTLTKIRNARSWVILARSSAVQSIIKQIKKLCVEINSNTDIQVDLLLPHLAQLEKNDIAEFQYFSTKITSFPWHLDANSFLLFRKHYNVLNFYIPIIKSVPKLSNIDIVAFDVLEKLVPEFVPRLLDQGCTSYVVNQAENSTLVTEGKNGNKFVLPVNLDKIKETPELELEDLLILRQDTIHRTQDVLTDRASLSLRITSSHNLVDYNYIDHPCILSQPGYHTYLQQQFSKKGVTKMSILDLLKEKIHPWYHFDDIFFDSDRARTFPERSQ